MDTSVMISSCVTGQMAYQLVLIILYFPLINPHTRGATRHYINHYILNKPVSLAKMLYRLPPLLIVV